jgi:hypothetical protein
MPEQTYLHGTGMTCRILSSQPLSTNLSPFDAHASGLLQLLLSKNCLEQASHSLMTNAKVLLIAVSLQRLKQNPQSGMSVPGLLDCHDLSVLNNYVACVDLLSRAGEVFDSRCSCCHAGKDLVLAASTGSCTWERTKLTTIQDSGQLLPDPLQQQWR